MKTYEEVRAEVELAVSKGGDDRFRLTAAFAGLRKLGYIARARYQCCGSCASYSIATDIKKRLGLSSLEEIPEDDQKSVTWNLQSDASAFAGDRNLVTTLHIHWGGDASEILGILAYAGMRVEWNGSKDQTIQVLPRPEARHYYVNPTVYALPNQPCRICSKPEGEHGRAQYWRGKRVA